MKARDIIIICDPYREIRSELARIEASLNDNKNQAYKMERFHSKQVKHKWKKK